MTLTNTARITALEKLHPKGTPPGHHTHPTPAPTPPPSGIPAIPAGLGTKLRKVFTDGTLDPFHGLTTPNAHPGTFEVKYGDFVTDAAHISVHDGYLALRATRRADGRYDVVRVGTQLDDLANPPHRTFEADAISDVRFMARMTDIGTRTLWIGCWQWDPYAPTNTEFELDWPETNYGNARANMHNPNHNGIASVPMPSGWHEWRTVRTSTYVAFLLDGVEKGRQAVASPAKTILLASVNVGIPWDNVPPDATTPDTVALDIAWVTVD